MGRAMRRIWPRPGRRRNTWLRPGGGKWLSAALGIGLALLCIHGFDAGVRPLAEEIACTKAKNAVTAVLNDAVDRTLAAQPVAYRDIIQLQTDQAGQITALTTDTAKMNTLRTAILEYVVEQVSSLDSTSLSIPLGDLTGFTSASDRGPRLPVRVLSVASAEASFRNQFQAAGVNQTLHQVMLEVAVDVKLLIPGGTVETRASAQVCVAETVIVGQVPDAYLQMGTGDRIPAE